MALAQGGDHEAYRALLDDLIPVLRAFLRRRVPNVSEVDDIVQDVLLAVHRARHTWDPTRPLEPWLFAIARNVAIDHARRTLSRAGWEVAVEEPPDAPGAVDAPFAPRLDAALEKLPRAQREAFRMLKLDGLSVEEAAERAGTTPGALKVRAHRAYKALRSLLGVDDG
jgi:RNA polymerase sigma-70 factor (ECF subfamily)